MTLDEFTELYEAAARLERAGRFTEARDAFLVAGDAAEELSSSACGHDDCAESREMARLCMNTYAADYARDARRRAMQNHVTAWARHRWPEENHLVHDVTFSQFPFGTFGRRASRVDMQIRRRFQHPLQVTHVTVGRRGDIRIEDSESRSYDTQRAFGRR